MSELNLTDRQEILKQINQFKLQLEQAIVKHRDASFKHTREAKVLKRVVTNLSTACMGYNEELDNAVSSLKAAFQQQQDVSKLIPRLAILERMLKLNTNTMEKQKIQLDERVRHSGETLQRIPGLPAQLKRDLRNLLTFPSPKNQSQLDQAARLLTIYEKSIKIITSSSAHTLHNKPEVNQELLNKLAEELQHLISELDFDGESGDLLNDIRIKLLVGIGAEALIELTLQILKLVIEGTHYERKTSEKFLTQLNVSLNKMLKRSTQSVEQTLSYAEHRNQMTSELLAISAESQAALDDAVDVESAKSAVKPLLDQIAMLTERLKHNEQRENSLIERMQHNNRQMEGLYELTQDHRRRLDEQAKRILIDPLTNVFNRTAFLERLELEYHKWIRAQNDICIILFDIDNFKSLNDSFGYTAGDKALKIIARTITKEARDIDIVARFSGEEFVLIVPDIELKKSTHLIEKIQLNISKLPFRFKDQNISITVSSACTAIRDTDTPEEVLNRLNLLLSQTKHKGKSQVIIK
ncbi:GGDEF domain-containing protein [Vibrio sp. MA40-2]|uniref:GGDEF domain-containing protein n=1 Tax=Vibrio sp. MA40-2 TaxID=3391828 RepID=UPI0039A75F1B